MTDRCMCCGVQFDDGQPGFPSARLKTGRVCPTCADREYLETELNMAGDKIRRMIEDRDRQDRYLAGVENELVRMTAENERLTMILQSIGAALVDAFPRRDNE